ncbi:hypothetical protein FOA52_015113 [Chlamydomonas sp. UWO 241]|nr:hypothetical protein FOA52_015113 [Chlamydomonas sp. UWO 241]
MALRRFARPLAALALLLCLDSIAASSGWRGTSRWGGRGLVGGKGAAPAPAPELVDADGAQSAADAKAAKAVQQQEWEAQRLKKSLTARAALDKLTDPRESDAVAAMLGGDGPEWGPKMPRGVEVYCPVLKLGRTNDPDGPNPSTFARALNTPYELRRMDWDSAMRDELASVFVSGVWWSGHAPATPVTMVTQATVDRLPQLRSQCRSWRGGLSVALYLALEQTDISSGKLSDANVRLLAKAAAHVHNFFLEIERNGTMCALDVMLVLEVFVEHKAMMLYPINVLRNLARLQARTPLVGLVDVDMLISHTFYDELVSSNALRGLLLSRAANGTAFVLPAFETYGSTEEAAALADHIVDGDKARLMVSVKSGQAGPFDTERFPQGHASTLFDKWYTAEGGPYHIEYGSRYEPWTIVDRVVAPWHDARFRGYGQNKIVHVAAMNASGFEFMVVAGEAFIVHRAHSHTTMRLRLVASKQLYDAARITRQPSDKTTIYGHTRELFDRAQEEMLAGTFRPTLDAATCAGLATLSWFSNVPGGGDNAKCPPTGGA